MTIFRLPDLGEGLRDAEIVAWHVAPGDRVVTDQPLVSVETDKAVVEIPSPRSGTIAKVCGEAGEIIEVGEPLVEFTDGEAVDEGTVVGRIAESKPPTSKVTPRAKVPHTSVKAAPAARALARTLGLDIARVRSTGPDGIVTSRDVQRAVEKETRRLTKGYEPLRGARRAMARHMTAARVSITPATITDEAVVDTWQRDTDVTLRLVRAIAAGCLAEPALNAWFDQNGLARKLNAHVDLGVAIDTDEGLFVPVLRNVEILTAADIKKQLEMVKTQAATHSIAHDTMKDPTITLSNFGTLGGQFGALVVLPPQVAILGAGQIKPRAAFIEGQVKEIRLLPLSLTFDHRAVTGGEALRFLRTVIGDLESTN